MILTPNAENPYCLEATSPYQLLCEITKYPVHCLTPTWALTKGSSLIYCEVKTYPNTPNPHHRREMEYFSHQLSLTHYFGLLKLAI